MNEKPANDGPNPKPLDLDIGSPGQNSRMHAATKNQSSVTPEDYPLAEREIPTEAINEHPAKDIPKDKK